MDANIYLVSLGCDKNRVDGETMVGTLINAGYSVINQPADAAVIIVNTCGFIREAVEESINLILELSEFKTEGKCKGLIVVGCMAERYKDEILEAIPETDVIAGVGDYEDIAATVGNITGGAPSSKKTKHARLAARADDPTPHIAYVKIAEGCDNHCTYCTIPSIRGPYKSRTMEDILEETKALTSAGAKEIVLVAQDTALYGIDIYKQKKLPELLRLLAKESGAAWIRLMYAYPEHITHELIDTMAELPQVCNYIDMPIQHSENKIIKAMGRGGSKENLVKLITRLREKMPDIAIRTTLIVGFPGETSRDFENMRYFVREMRFDRLGVFPYSREEGTPAAIMPKQVRESTKQNRLAEVMDLQQRIHFGKQENKVSKVLEVIVDAVEADGSYTGRTRYDAYEVDSVVTFTAENALTVGDICNVEITDSHQYDLKGRTA